MINLKDVLIYFLTASLMTLIYIGCFNVAQKGYGYSGYRGFHHHHHHFGYHRNDNESYSPSNRESSRSGNNFSKRGISGGK